MSRDTPPWDRVSGHGAPKVPSAVALPVAALLVVLGCGGGSEPSPDAAVADGGAGDGGVDGLLDVMRTSYCRPLAAWLCERLEACGCTEASSRIPRGADCRESLLSRCVERIQRAIEEAPTGTSLRIDREAITACIDAQRGGPPCELPSAERTASFCAAALYEDVALGEPCRFQVCARGRGVCREGRCEERPGLGEPCSSSEPCEAPLMCIEGRCRREASLGDACDANLLCPAGSACLEGRCEPLRASGESCESDEACGDGLRCFEGRCTEVPSHCDPGGEAVCGAWRSCLLPNERRCVQPAGEGEPCERTEHCRKGLYCDPERGRCLAGPGEGEPCGDGVYCALGLACDFERIVCAPVPREGAPCALGERGPNVCAEGLACLRVSSGPGMRLGTCGPPPAEGEACAAEAVCAEGLVCDFLTDGRNVCVPPKGEGEPCMADRACVEGTFCDLSLRRCAPRRPEGASCEHGNECAAGLACLPGPDGTDWKCLPPPEEGDACVTECAPGLLCRLQTRVGRCLPGICTLPVARP